MTEPSLTDRLRETLREARARRAEEDRIALAAPAESVADLDEEADRTHERLLSQEARELRAVKLAAIRLIGLWLRAPVHARVNALTALTAPINFAKHGEDGEPGVHLVIDQALVCTQPWCLQDVISGLPAKAREAIELTASSVPIHPDDQLALAADAAVDQYLAMGAIGHVRQTTEDTLKVPPDTGTLGARLAALLREDTDPVPGT